MLSLPQAVKIRGRMRWHLACMTFASILAGAFAVSAFVAPGFAPSIDGALAALMFFTALYHCGRALVLRALFSAFFLP